MSNKTKKMSAAAAGVDNDAPNAVASPVAPTKKAKLIFSKPGSAAFNRPVTSKNEAGEEITVPGSFTNIINNVRAFAESTNQIAQAALMSGDRKGVLALMKAGTSLARTQSTLEKILARAERVRLLKDEKAEFAKTGALPEGVIQVLDDEPDDEELDDENGDE